MQVRPDCEGNSTTLAVKLLTFAWHHDADRAIAHSRDGSPGTGAGGRTRTGTGFRPTDFLTSYGFRRSRRGRGICGLDYPFTLAPATRGRRFRCRPSSLYTFPGRPASRAWLGIARSEVSPNLSGSTSRVSPGALKASAQVRCVYQFRHARVTLLACHRGMASVHRRLKRPSKHALPPRPAQSSRGLEASEYEIFCRGRSADARRERHDHIGVGPASGCDPMLSA